MRVLPLEDRTPRGRGERSAVTSVEEGGSAWGHDGRAAAGGQRPTGSAEHVAAQVGQMGRCSGNVSSACRRSSRSAGQVGKDWAGLLDGGGGVGRKCTPWTIVAENRRRPIGGGRDTAQRAQLHPRDATGPATAARARPSLRLRDGVEPRGVGAGLRAERLPPRPGLVHRPEHAEHARRQPRE